MADNDNVTPHLADNYKEYTYDMFMMNMSPEPEEMLEFSTWIDRLSSEKIFSFETVRSSPQNTEVDLVRKNGEGLHVLNFSSFNYLGLSNHPEVIDAAIAALKQYGLGACSSPVLSGTYRIHQLLEQKLVDFFGLPDRGVSLFTSGYGANIGAIQAFVKPGGYVVMDQFAHTSIVEGAKLSGANNLFFNHNDMADLERILQEVCDSFTRVLICIEGVYSGDGDFGNVKRVVELARKYGAYTLVDEAHSALVAGEHGRGVAELHGVLADVDLYVMTMSKGLGGIGGAVYAKKEICQYINFYAKSRMFSTALDPGVSGGMIKVLELAMTGEGEKRREQLKKNADYLRSLLAGKVNIGKTESWIIAIKYGQDKKTVDVSDYLQRNGLDTSLMQFPAVPRNEGRIRLFITSEHTKAQIEKAASIILRAAEKFDFLI